VTRAELLGKTVIEATPDSEQASVYRKLAKAIINNKKKYVPSPLEPEQLKDWAEKWSDSLLGQRDEIAPSCRLDYVPQEAEIYSGR
jgi:nitrogenase iron protein NifH